MVDTTRAKKLGIGQHRRKNVREERAPMLVVNEFGLHQLDPAE